VTRLKVGSYKQNVVHKVLEIHDKGSKDRLVPLAKEAEEWLEAGHAQPPLFRPLLGKPQTKGLTAKDWRGSILWGRLLRKE